MSENFNREWLRGWNTYEFLAVQRDLGRANLPSSRIAQYAHDFDIVERWLTSSDLSPEDTRCAQLLKAVTAPFAALRADPVPRYYSYTGVNLLDEYLGGGRLDWNAQKALCVHGMHGLMLDLTRFESHSMVGIEPWSQDRFDTDVTSTRLRILQRQFDALKTLAGLLNLGLSADVPSVVAYRTIEEYCKEESLLAAVVHFTCLPRTRFHDEVLFLRTIAEDELCFEGIYLAVRQAGEAIERKMYDVADAFILEASAFASMLHESFRVLQSMPPEHFADFRDATGEASAVQSFNYQRLDVTLFGMNPEKAKVYERVPHLRSLVHFSSRDFASLKSMLQSLPDRGALGSKLVDSAKLLDRHLLSWRGLHLSFALRYLPPEVMGTGGTSGPSYLQKFLRHSLFVDTEPDFALIDEIFGTSSDVEDIFRAQAGSRIAPPQAMWAGAPGNTKNKEEKA